MRSTRRSSLKCRLAQAATVATTMGALMHRITPTRAALAEPAGNQVMLGFWFDSADRESHLSLSRDTVLYRGQGGHDSTRASSGAKLGVFRGRLRDWIDHSHSILVHSYTSSESCLSVPTRLIAFRAEPKESEVHRRAARFSRLSRSLSPFPASLCSLYLQTKLALHQRTQTDSYA